MPSMQVRGYFNMYKPHLPCQIRFIEYVNDSTTTRLDVENIMMKVPTFRGWFTEWVEVHPDYNSIEYPDTSRQK